MPPDTQDTPPDEVYGMAPPEMVRPRSIPGQVYREGALYVPAGFWPRAGAFLIDAVILFIAHQIALQIIPFVGPTQEQLWDFLERVFDDILAGGVLSAGTLNAMSEIQRMQLFTGWLNVFICMAYFTVFHGMLGATLGKLSLGLRVMQRDGKPLGFGRALLRYLGYFIVAKLIYTAWLIPLNAERRTLYDMALGTNVFRQAPAAAPMDASGQQLS